jgi:putative ABC transport system substrate-binding protein
MRRREFIAGLAGAAAAGPFAARAQQPAMPVIGWLSSRNSETDALVLPAFRRALGTHGFVEGRNVAIEYRWADSQFDRLPTLAAELVRRPSAVIVAVDTFATRAVQAASSTVPILFTAGADPVKLGLVPNLNRPAGNVTGTAAYLSQLGQKRLALLHELLPRASVIAVLRNPVDDFDETADLLAAGQTLGLQLKILNAANERQLEAAFASMQQMHAGALFVTTDPFFFGHARQIVTLAESAAIPAAYSRREFTVAGGLMSYGSDAEEYYRVLGDYAGRILKGAKAGDLPVQQATRYEFVINLKTAKALGLTIPETLLATADEVIQ